MRYKKSLALAIFLFLIASCFISLTIGSKTNGFNEAIIRLPEAFRVAFQGETSTDELTLIIGQLRIPRTLIAVFVGMALGAAGCLIQGHTRNPLADPGILGINAGAALAVVLCIWFGITTSPSGYVWPAIIGCALAAMAVFSLSSTGSSAGNPLSIILAGVAISALLMAVVNALVLSSDSALDALRSWSTGSVAGRDISVLKPTAPIIAFGLILALTQIRALNLLALGEAVASSLGLPVQRYRILGITGVAILGGAATAAAGPIHFIGLAAPHIARSIMGPDYKGIIPLAIALGGTLALWADIIGRFVVRPSELQMGIVMALIGVPFFIMLIRRGKVYAL